MKLVRIEPSNPAITQIGLLNPYNQSRNPNAMVNMMKEDRGKEITRIYPTEWQNYVGNIFLLFGSIGIMFLSFSIYSIITVGFKLWHIMMLILPLMFILFARMVSKDLFYEPLIIYNDGIIPANRKFDVKLNGRSEFISFDEIKNIEYLKGDFLGVVFIFKNKTQTIERINNQNDYNIIKEAFNKYKYSYHGLQKKN